MTPVIWTYWHQGFDKAPLIVKRCMQRIHKLHPDFNIHFLDVENVYKFAEQVPITQKKWEELSLPHKSDLIRTQLLIKYGGIWIDPTVFCRRPLDTWLPAIMDNGIFLFHRPGKDRIISNWFIAAEKDNYLLKQLYQNLIEYWNQNDFRNLGSNNTSQLEYWSKRIVNGRSLEFSQLWLSPLFTKVLRLYPYMIYHYMFYHLIKKDAHCRAIFKAMSKISSDGPHRLQRLGLLEPLSEDVKELVQSKAIPLFKLKWNIDSENLPKNCNLAYLFNQ